MTALGIKIISAFLNHNQNRSDNKLWSQGPKYLIKTK